MDVRLDHGRDGLHVQLPDSAKLSILEPRVGTPVVDATKAVEAALARPIASPPLTALARGRGNAVVVISDKTRPVPNALILRPILQTLEAAGISSEHIEILVATGLHRPNTLEELCEMTSPDLVARYRFRNHAARNPDEHVHQGTTTRGTEIWVDRGFIAADLKVVTGLIEPHLMAGYSGGRKAVVPGLAGVETMRSAHGPRMLEDDVGPGIIDGNPFHEDLLEIVRRVGVDFMVNVTIDRARRLTGVFAGDIERAHAEGMAFLEHEVRVDIESPADIVLASAGGYPLDATYYQSIKGLVAALNIVRPGGTIILAAALSEGIGSVDFQELLRDAGGNDEYMRRITSPGFFRIDQWMVQHLCQVRRKAEIILVSQGVPPEIAPGLMATAAPTVEEALRRAFDRFGATAHLAVLPQGPYVLPTVKGRKLSLGRAWLADAA